MVVRIPRYPKEEFARRGDAIYDRVVRPTLKPKDKGKFGAIDIETGEFEMDANELTAGDKLIERNPDVQLWMVRVGYSTLRQFGGQALREEL